MNEKRWKMEAMIEAKERRKPKEPVKKKGKYCISSDSDWSVCWWRFMKDLTWFYLFQVVKMKEYGREKFEKREKARLIEERKRNRLMIKSKFIYLEEQMKD